MKNHQLSIDRYEAYKDSGIEWLGEVPDHWKSGRLKDIILALESGVSVNAANLPAQSNESGILKTSCVSISGFDPNENKTILEEEIVRAKCNPRKGNIIISRMNTPELVGASGFIGKDYPNLFLPDRLWQTVFYSNAKINSKWLSYLLTVTKFREVVSFSATGSSPSMKNLSQENFLKIAIPLPSISEQESIADYLDTKTAQIDRKIELLTQKATLYGDLKRSLINETVTRGLDKSVPMKDSAIEWIGEVPEHWETRRINDIAIQSKRKNIGLIENNLLSLSYGKIKRRNIDTSFGLLPESFETYQIVEAGNIILRLTDLQNDQRSLRVGLATERGIITSAYLCLGFFKNVYPIFAYYLLFAYDISKVFYWFGGGLRQSMKFEDFKVFPFILSPFSEQKAIADYLDTKTAQIDQIIQTINTQIEKLQELRKTLINDVVTGKIKVIDN